MKIEIRFTFFRLRKNCEGKFNPIWKYFEDSSFLWNMLHPRTLDLEWHEHDEAFQVMPEGEYNKIDFHINSFSCNKYFDFVAN